METLKKIYSAICVVVALFAAIGGTIVFFCYHQPVFAVANIALAAMAAPFVIERLKNFLEWFKPNKEK